MPKYKIVRGYLSKDKSESIANHMLQNHSDHALPGFKDFRMSLHENDNLYYDPDNIISKLIEEARSWFLENYDTKELIFNRVHGTLMYPGSFLWDHIDEEGQYNNGNSYVCLLFLSEYEGGDLIFSDEKLSFHFDPGDAIFFPGCLIRHEVSEITDGVRINLIAHFFGEKPNAI